VRDAINAAKAGVTASIVGSGAGTRLVLRGADGAASSVRISASDSDGNDTDTAGLSALAWDPAPAPYEPFTLVNQAVEAAKRSRSSAGQAGFVNACLRRFLREREALVAATDADPVARWNHPAWWIERLQRDHPEHWQALLAANQQPGPMTLRVNRRRVSRDDYRQQLQAAGLDRDAPMAAPGGHACGSH